MRSSSSLRRPLALSFLACAAATAIAIACSDGDPIGTSEEERSPGPRVDASVVIKEPPAPDAGRAEPPIRLFGGYFGLCALTTATGATRCWGSNEVGQAGNGTATDASVPGPVTGLTASELDPNFGHACAVDTAKRVSCWGGNADGELGHDPSADLDAGDGGTCSGAPCARTPVPVSGLRDMIGVSTGFHFSCARGAAGLACWGLNYNGGIGLDAGFDRSSTPNVIALADVAEHVSGGYFSCARKTSGAVWCWGDNLYGELGQDPAGTADAAPFDEDTHPVPRQVAGMLNARAIAAGTYHACAVLADATVSCWGSNGAYTVGSAGGQLGHDPAADFPCSGTWLCSDRPTVVSGLTDVREIALGYYHSCAVRADDTVWCWGYDDVGRLGRDPTSQIDAGDGDGGPQPMFRPRQVLGLTNVAHIAAAHSTTCAVTWDGKVACWGDNRHGELAGATDGGSALVPTPVKL